MNHDTYATPTKHSSRHRQSPNPLHLTRLAVRRNEVLCGIALLVAIILGGATQKGVLSDSIVEAASLPILLVGALDLRATYERYATPIRALLALIVVIPIFQLIPLPTTMWELLPGREPVLAAIQAAGLPPLKLGVSISPWATERSSFCLIPAIAIYLGYMTCRPDERRRLWVLVLAAALACIVLQAMQLADGPESELRFQSYPARDVGIGFLANSNHTAAFLYSMIPVSAYVYLSGPRRVSALFSGMYLGFNLLLLLGLSMTLSRTALGLGLLAWLLTFALLLRKRLQLGIGHKPVGYLAAGAIVLAAFIIALSYGLETIVGRLSGGALSGDVRWILNRLSFSLATNYWPFGSGLGTFERVFPLAQSSGTTIPAIVNHVHNDILELIIETGAFGVTVVATWLFIAIRSAARIAYAPTRELRDERAAAMVVCSLLFLHSFWDYPLRTCTLAAIFAAACAALSSALLNEHSRGEAEAL